MDNITSETEKSSAVVSSGNETGEALPVATGAQPARKDVIDWRYNA